MNTNFLFFILGFCVFAVNLSAFSQDREDLPHVLILGASNSMRLTDKVRESLKGEALVFRAERNGEPENCQGATKDIENIDR